MFGNFWVVSYTNFDLLIYVRIRTNSLFQIIRAYTKIPLALKFSPRFPSNHFPKITNRPKIGQLASLEETETREN